MRVATLAAAVPATFNTPCKTPITVAVDCTLTLRCGVSASSRLLSCLFPRHIRNMSLLFLFPLCASQIVIHHSYESSASYHGSRQTHTAEVLTRLTAGVASTDDAFVSVIRNQLLQLDFAHVPAAACVALVANVSLYGYRGTASGWRFCSAGGIGKY
jgi:hypothetical protein